MARIGKYEYPEVQIGTLLTAIDKLIRTYDNNPVKDEETFAKSLGHKTNKSGTFTGKMSALRKYGLIEPRDIRATTLAKHIIKPINNKEKEQSISKMIENVELWMDLHNRLKNKSPSKEDFKIALIELTGDRDKALKSYERIRGLYTEAIGYYKKYKKEAINLNSSVNSYKTEEENFEENQEVKKVPENMIKLVSGEVNIALPRNSVNIDIIKNILDGMKNFNPAGTQPPKETTGHPKEEQKKDKGAGTSH